LIAAPQLSREEGLFDVGGRLQVEDVQFVKEAAEGLRSALLSEAELLYPDYPDAPKRRVQPGEFVVFDPSEGVELSRLRIEQGPPSLRLKVSGRVSKAVVGAPDVGASTDGQGGRWVDGRLSAYEQLRYGTMWNLIGVVAVWGLGTTWACYEAWVKLSARGRARRG
jgi:hypothetical protein